ncbi:MAG: glycosyltransferase, partial [Armatimonadota bacterium]|nr:glycosyltransferase [Armatimonadota bacterium]
LETWKRRLINALLGRCASQVVAVSNAVGDALKNAGVPPKKITCIHNGVDVSRYMKQNGANLRQELCIENDGRVVGMVANFRPAKDYELAIRAADIVIKRIPRTHFIFAGDGVDKTAEPILKLQALLGMNGNVFLLGFREDIPNILSTLDLFILASKVEGLPVSVIEAMAAGLPVVASNVGGMAELVDEGVTGFLVPPGDCNKFAERIMDILLNFELAKSMGTAGKLKAIKNFSLEAMTKAYYSLYVKLASSRS